MKKIVLVVIVLLVCGIFLVQSRKEKKQETANDLEKIKQVQAACEKVVYSRALFTVGSDTNTWYVFDLELMFQDSNEAQKVIAAELGSDFSTKLSNGDRLFVGFHQHLQKYRIYAGDPKIEGNMIYPTWEYKKVSPEE